jgi:hypothetical protein
VTARTARSAARTERSGGQTKRSGEQTKRSGEQTKRSGARTKKSGARTKRFGEQTDSAALERARRRALGLDGSIAVATVERAAAFVARVGIALRYGASEALPLASMYAACGGDDDAAQRRAATLTNAMLERRDAVEITCVGGRVSLAHRTLVPALLALVRRGRAVDELDLSDDARRALKILREHPRPTAGYVRARWGVPPKTWPNPADAALAELQRGLVVDRGPTSVPERGAAYLGKDGIPYRFVDDVHADHVRAARALDVAEAATRLLAAYLDGAVFATRRKLASMFAACASAGELAAALDELAADGRVDIARAGGSELVILRDHRH